MSGRSSIRGLAGGAIACVALAGCGGGGATTPTHSAARHSRSHGGTRSTPAATSRTTTRAAPPPPTFAHLTSAPLATGPTTGLVPAATWRGQTAAWIARSAGGVALMSFDQRFVELHLHSGTIDAGSSGWRFGPSVGGAEARHLLAAFNGAFRLATGSGGFMADGRVAAPLRSGLGSVVTYTDGSTDIGAWGAGVPAPGKTVASVRQNLALLIDNGTPSSNLGCLTCWGATLGGVVDPARSALGITAAGHLVWAGGEHLTVSDLANALLGVQVVRAVELDINPEWVAGYFYGHRGGHGPLAPVPVVPGQNGIPGEYLVPWSRDFFAVATRSGA
ncbi:MAG TPA: hypothetical protein VG275_03705 [Solirubrobacteraceae bacterium]|nr:hypothetical protein [Solirubrobacteraceae bacterium]